MYNLYRRQACISKDTLLLLLVGTELVRVQFLCVLDFVGVVVALVPVREGYLT